MRFYLNKNEQKAEIHLSQWRTSQSPYRCPTCQETLSLNPKRSIPFCSKCLHKGKLSKLEPVKPAFKKRIKRPKPSPVTVSYLQPKELE